MTAATSTKPASTTSGSRRALLVGAIGGIGAVAAGAVARVSPVRAEGEAIVVGGEYTTATSQTKLLNQANGSTVFWAASTAGGIGVYGTSDSSYAVYGTSTSSVGVFGSSETDSGVYGASFAGSPEPAIRGWHGGNGTAVLGGSGSVPTAKPKTGVYGHANQDSGSKGVWGFSGRGAGVYGQASSAGYALRANGRIKVDKVSGVATINKGNVSVTLNPGVKVTASSFVLLTPRANIGSRGLWYSTNPTAGTITVHLSSSRTSATKIGWLLLG